MNVHIVHLELFNLVACIVSKNLITFNWFYITNINRLDQILSFKVSLKYFQIKLIQLCNMISIFGGESISIELQIISDFFQPCLTRV